jgi:hypothetical protein
MKMPCLLTKVLPATAANVTTPPRRFACPRPGSTGARWTTFPSARSNKVVELIVIVFGTTDVRTLAERPLPNPGLDVALNYPRRVDPDVPVKNTLHALALTAPAGVAASGSIASLDGVVQKDIEIHSSIRP